MKKILLVLTFVTSLSYAQVTTFPWVETFEDSSPTSTQWICEYIGGTNTNVPSGVFWSIKGTTSVGYISSTAPYQGAKMAVFDTRSHTRDAVAKFISPVIDLTNVTNPKLDFYYRNLKWGTDQNLLNIYYRTSNTSPWVLITTFNTSIPTWANSGEITLPNPSATYQIALEGVAMYGYGLDVDNLEVKEGVLSTPNRDKKLNVTVFPNPTSDYLVIKSEKIISEISIFDPTGKQISKSAHGNTESQISVRHLPTGVYMIQVKDIEGVVTSQKFIRK